MSLFQDSYWEKFRSSIFSPGNIWGYNKRTVFTAGFVWKVCANFGSEFCKAKQYVKLIWIQIRKSFVFELQLSDASATSSNNPLLDSIGLHTWTRRITDCQTRPRMSSGLLLLVWLPLSVRCWRVSTLTGEQTMVLSVTTRRNQQIQIRCAWESGSGLP
jgi:hypothetical protein